MSSRDVDPVEGIEEALQRLDFESARIIAASAHGPEKKRLGEVIAAARTEADERAEHLAARIQSLARADHYEGLLALAADPTTEPLLALVSPELRRGAMLHLDGAVRRRQRFRSAARRHMKAAADALVLFDTTKALSEIGKVDPRWLAESQLDELEKLRTQADHAVSERRELDDRTAAVLREHLPPAPISRTRSGSCLGTLLAAISGLVAIAAMFKS